MKFWLSLPPRLAHDWAPVALKVAAGFREPFAYEWRPFSWRGLHFKNRLGLAGGVDKDGSLIEEWWTFGPGFIEIGTVTPQPQEPNSGSILDRDPDSETVWNRMGFPSRGAWCARDNLLDLSATRTTPVFVNIGKNRTTPNDDAARDYAACIDVLSGLADVFVINISSPNTTGLRELLQPQHLKRFLGGVMAARNKSSAPATPYLLKLSPDLEEKDIEAIVDVSCSLGIDGFIATNTTLARDFGSRFPAEGGISGRPLQSRSVNTLKTLMTALGSAKHGRLIISAGGVLSPNDVKERLALGADLVQVYSALIFQGPAFFRRVAESFQK